VLDALPRRQVASARRLSLPQLRRFLGTSLGLALLAVPAVAHAGPMDPALERLVDAQSAGCRTPNGDYVAGRECVLDGKAVTRLLTQLGTALAPTVLHPARTVGYGGFRLSIEGAYTSIASESSYWKQGTRGPTEEFSGQTSTSNPDPSSGIQVYSANLRKGFGFGLELGANAGLVPETSLMTVGADLRMALLEGFREGFAGYLPDVAVGGGVRTVPGSSQFDLTIASLDVELSKPFTIAGSSVLTPWVGFQQLWLFGDSGVIDLTPGTDPLTQCNYVGDHLPGTVDPTADPSAPPPPYTGQPYCTDGGTDADFNNNAVFRDVRTERRRIVLGLSLQHETAFVSGVFMTDLGNPEDAQSSAFDKQQLAGMPSQWTVAGEVGLSF
jgi:hypothetical protein